MSCGECVAGEHYGKGKLRPPPPPGKPHSVHRLTHTLRRQSPRGSPGEHFGTFFGDDVFPQHHPPAAVRVRVKCVPNRVCTCVRPWAGQCVRQRLCTDGVCLEVRGGVRDRAANVCAYTPPFGLECLALCRGLGRGRASGRTRHYSAARVTTPPRRASTSGSEAACCRLGSTSNVTSYLWGMGT